MEKMYDLSLSKAKLHVAKGNTKIGKTIYAFSTLPGNKEHKLFAKGKLLTDVEGTCSGNCDGCFKDCYARSSVIQHHNVCVVAWGDNTLLMRYEQDRIFRELDAYISDKNKKYLQTNNPADLKLTLFRINVSGEVKDAIEFARWNTLALQHPEVNFGLYTKNFGELDKFMQEHPEGTANNFVINISQWHHVADNFLKKYPGQFNIFEYDDSNRANNTLTLEDIARLKTITACPAVDIKGKHTKDKNGNSITCDHCKRCYRKTGFTTKVWAH